MGLGLGMPGGAVSKLVKPPVNSSWAVEVDISLSCSLLPNPPPLAHPPPPFAQPLRGYFAKIGLRFGCALCLFRP